MGAAMLSFKPLDYVSLFFRPAGWWFGYGRLYYEGPRERHFPPLPETEERGPAFVHTGAPL